MLNDFFRPAMEPAQSIYDAFVLASSTRHKKDMKDWLHYERVAVLQASTKAAVTHRLRAPTLTDVENAEQIARGHCDYGAKWARTIANMMRAT